jgi:hypothetical protein
MNNPNYASDASTNTTTAPDPTWAQANNGQPRTGNPNRVPGGGGNTEQLDLSNKLGTVSHEGQTAKDTSNPIESAFASVHGAGEAVRGLFNSKVDEAFHEVCHESRVTSLTTLSQNGLGAGTAGQVISY